MGTSDRKLHDALTRRTFLGAAGAAGLGLGLAGATDQAAAAAPAARAASSSNQVFYWLSHGSSSDQIWAIANSGAVAAGRDLGVTVHTVFNNNDVARHEEAFTTAIAAKPAGIATSSPQPKVLDKLIAQAQSRGIPVVTFNTDDPASTRTAYVGADLLTAGKLWATYLVATKRLHAGDLVWLPVEVAGATYGVVETQGIASVFKPLGIKYDVVQVGYTPATSISNMQDYLTAHGSNVKGMIGLGDLVTANTEQVFKAVGWQAGHIPVVGWGNELATAQAVQQGYVNAALWQYPDSQGYMPIAILKMLADGLGAGYDIATLKLYDKSTVGNYIKFLH
jgi:simple sugar transport system substrate-binding protein